MRFDDGLEGGFGVTVRGHGAASQRSPPPAGKAGRDLADSVCQIWSWAPNSPDSVWRMFAGGWDSPAVWRILSVDRQSRKPKISSPNSTLSDLVGGGGAPCGRGHVDPGFNPGAWSRSRCLAPSGARARVGGKMAVGAVAGWAAPPPAVAPEGACGIVGAPSTPG